MGLLARGVETLGHVTNGAGHASRVAGGAVDLHEHITQGPENGRALSRIGHAAETVAKVAGLTVAVIEAGRWIDRTVGRRGSRR